MSFAVTQTNHELSGRAKFVEVTRLLDMLGKDLDTPNLQPHQRDALLEQLKIYGRNPDNADPIFTEHIQGIETLARHSFNSPNLVTSRHALRCLANALLLRPATRQIYVDLGYEAKACLRLKSDNRDDEFLVSRVLFLTTYDTNIKLANLIDQHRLAEIINLNLQRHAKRLEKKKKKPDPMEEMALTEILKLLFNISHFCPQRANHFVPAVPNIVTLIYKRSYPPTKPMAGAMGSLINSLINLEIIKDDDAMYALYPRSCLIAVTEKLTEILDLSLRAYSTDETEQQVSPLLTLFRKVYEYAPRIVKTYMKKVLLPSEDDRNQVLGRADSLSSRLLQLSTSPMAPQAREAVSNLLFEMSDLDARRFVQNVGYGFASGFLFSHNVPMPENALEAYSTNEDDARSSSSSRRPVNPITGQRLDAETSSTDLPEMTQEEKEREAERLMVLFDRLKRNGVIDVENPVAQAAREGRLMELDSDDESV